jgi:hypothetical protein
MSSVSRVLLADASERAGFANRHALILCVLLALIVTHPSRAQPSGQVVVDDYVLVSSQRISRTVYEYVYKVDVSNWSGSDATIDAAVTSQLPQITVVSGIVHFGQVRYGATVQSTNTVVLRHDRTKPFDTSGLVWSTQTVALPPTSTELIEKDQAAGSLDAEMALLYRVFAEFNDPQLPAKYSGRSDDFFEATALQEAASLYATLSDSARQLIAPYLVFPDFSSATTFAASSQLVMASSLRAAAVAPPSYATIEWIPGVVKVGWDQNSPLAAALEATARALQVEVQTTIWPKLTSFLGAPAAGKRILVLLSDQSASNASNTTSDDCLTSKVTLYQTQNWAVTHELTHALLNLNFPSAACNNHDTFWMNEATATWAQQFVYPPGNLGDEQTTAPFFLRDPESSLFALTAQHQYGAYLWFFRLAGQGNDFSPVVATWRAADGGKESLEAIESVLQGSGLGGFADQWPKFGLDNWNRLADKGFPYRKYFSWDSLKTQAQEHPYVVKYEGSPLREDVVPFELPLLSTTYLHYQFAQDNTFRFIQFSNTQASAQPTQSIQALAKTKGKDWPSAVDWSTTTTKSFCRDKADEDLEELVLVIANRGFHSSDPAPLRNAGDATLQYLAIPCFDWVGSTHYERDSDDGETIVADTTGLQLQFTFDTTGVPFLAVVGGQGTWKRTVVRAGCSETTTGTFSPVAVAGRGRNGISLLPLANTVSVNGLGVAPVTFPGCAASSMDLEWLSTGQQTLPLNAVSFMDTNNQIDATFTELWTWNLRRAP